jgi:putative transposase
MDKGAAILPSTINGTPSGGKLKGESSWGDNEVVKTQNAGTVPATQGGIAMKKNSAVLEAPSREELRGFVERELRLKTREWIEGMANEELELALGIGRYERGEGRLGYRKGVRERSFTTKSGVHALAMPRAAYFDPGPDGKKEWNSKLVPRYARRTEAVEEALVAAYLCGTNTRRIKRSLSPLLSGAALSKSTVSRLVARLSEQFEVWKGRDLADDDIAMVFLDGFRLKLRIGRRVESVPVLCAVGVRSDGSKVLLCLEVRSSESSAAWRSVTDDLCRRGVKAPVLAVIDGSKGLGDAVKATWPWIEVQRCTKHKLENLFSHAPKRLYEEIKADYHAIVYAESEGAARKAWARFERKWEKSCPAVVKSLQEGGEELLTFFRFPRSLWKSLRTTNVIERMNGEFRRRVKTQGGLPDSEAGLRLLFGLFASGQITMRKIGGWRDLPAFIAAKRAEMGLQKPLDKVA